MNKRLILTLAVFLILVAGSYTWYTKHFPFKAPITKDNVTLTKSDFRNATGTNKFPTDFPKDIPADLSNISQSYSLNYVDDKVTLSGFIYTTNQSKNDLFNSYLQYVNKKNYIVTSKSNGTDGAYIVGKKDGDILSIKITEQNRNSTVTLGYTDKQ